MSQKVKFYSDAAKTNQVYPEIDLGENIEQGLENYFAMTADDGIYGVSWYVWSSSHSSNCTKYGKNAGQIITPATDTVIESSNYSKAFDTYDCNAFVDEDGVQHITYLKGDDNFGDTEDTIKPYVYNSKTYLQDVYVIKRTYYERWYQQSGIRYYERTFVPREGFAPVSQAVRKDGSIRPWFLISKYVSGADSQGRLRSLKGLAPARYVRNPVGASSQSYPQSYSAAYTKYKQRGDYYTAGLLADYKDLITTFWLKYGTRNTQSIMAGCTDYNYQYTIDGATTNDNKVKLTTSKASHYIVGSSVSIGDKGSETSNDRVNGYLHNIVDSAKIISIDEDENDSTYSYITLDCEPFTISNPSTSLISTMCWESGFSDKVLGRDGCPGNLTSGEYPIVLDGIETMVGGHELVGNAITSLADENGGRAFYTTNDFNKMSNTLSTITSTYDKSDYRTNIYMTRYIGDNLSFNKYNLTYNNTSLNGHTTQFTTTGNQLVDFNTPSYKSANVTMTFDNNILQVRDDTEENYSLINWTITDLIKNNPGKTLKFSMDSISNITGIGGLGQLNVEYSDGTSTQYLRYIKRDGTLDSANFFIIPNTTSNISKVAFGLYTNNSATASTGGFTITKPLLYFDNNNTFEPYTGGIASPSPDYPQGIQSATGEQSIQVCGKNLYDATLAEADFGGLKISADNEYMYFNGTPTINNGKVEFKPLYLNPGTYTLSMQLASGTVNEPILFQVYQYGSYVRYSGADLGISNNATRDYRTFTLNEPDWIVVTVWRRKTTNYDNAKVSYQITRGDTSDYTFESYSGTNYSVNLGKNLFDCTKQAGTFGNTTYSVASDGLITQSSNDANYWDVTTGKKFYLEAGTYTISINVESGTKGNMQLYNYYTDNNEVLTSGNSATFTLTERTALGFKTYGSQGVYPVSYYLQIESGVNATPYTEYKEPIMLNSLGDYQDKIYKSEGKWYLEKNTEKMILTSTLGEWSAFNKSFVLNDNDIPQVTSALCSAFTNIGDSWWGSSDERCRGKFSIANALHQFKCMPLEDMTLEDFISWLDTTQPTLYYGIPTPVITEITDQELITQLEAINIQSGLNNIITGGYLSTNTSVNLYTLGWNFITDMQLDLEKGIVMPTSAGEPNAGSDNGFADGHYANDLNYNEREIYLGGRLYGTNKEGLEASFISTTINDSWWYSLSRISINALGTEESTESIE